MWLVDFTTETGDSLPIYGRLSIIVSPCTSIFHQLSTAFPDWIAALCRPRGCIYIADDCRVGKDNRLAHEM